MKHILLRPSASPSAEALLHAQPGGARGQSLDLHQFPRRDVVVGPGEDDTLFGLRCPVGTGSLSCERHSRV